MLQNEYLPDLVDRLPTFNPWIHRRPRRNREGKQKQSLNPHSTADDPEWELTETGRLFYKLVFMKDFLLDRTRTDAKRSQQQIWIAARMRVYGQNIDSVALSSPCNLTSQLRRPS